MSIPKIMILFAIVISSILYWATSNVCRYNFALEKTSGESMNPYYIDHFISNNPKKFKEVFEREQK